jgi:hypothetical protein
MGRFGPKAEPKLGEQMRTRSRVTTMGSLMGISSLMSGNGSRIQRLLKGQTLPEPGQWPSGCRSRRSKPSGLRPATAQQTPATSEAVARGIDATRHVARCPFRTISARFRSLRSAIPPQHATRRADLERMAAQSQDRDTDPRLRANAAPISPAVQPPRRLIHCVAECRPQGLIAPFRTEGAPLSCQLVKGLKDA